MYSDHYIERWGSLFVNNRLDLVLKIRFEQFLVCPRYYLHRLNQQQQRYFQNCLNQVRFQQRAITSN